MDEPTELQAESSARAGWSEYTHSAAVIAQGMANRSKELWVYTHRVRCPHCHDFWTFQVANPVGTIVPNPNPVRIGLGLLCGACEGMRRAILVIPAKDGVKGTTGRFWTEKDSEHAMGILRENPKSYAIQITKSKEPWDPTHALVDDKQYALDFLFKRKGGRRSVGVSESFRAQYFPHWNVYISTSEAAT